MKTIKQLADEIGVSKDKVKYQVGKLPENYLVKVGKITHITNDGMLKIKETLLGKNEGNSPGKNREITHFSPSEENELYKILKAELSFKNELIETLQADLASERTHSREQADKLSDLAAQLAELSRNNQLLLGAEQSRTNPALLRSDEDMIHKVGKGHKKGFLQRLFGKINAKQREAP